MNNKKKIKGEIVNISVPISIKKKIASYANQKGYTTAGLLKELIIKYVHEYESKENDATIQDLLKKNTKLINILIRQNEEILKLIRKINSNLSLLYVELKLNRLNNNDTGQERESS